MDARPPPEVTIEGGPGWQLEGPRESPAQEDDEPAPERSGSWLARHRTAGLALAAAVGFAAATALAEVRLTTLRETDEGVLSLEVRPDQVPFGSTLVADPDGRAALTTSVVVRNTGPRPVALESAEVVGTPYRAESLDGRRVAGNDRTTIVLLRTVDCSRLERTRAPGPLRVRATTGAGIRTVDLRMDPSVLQFHDEQVRGACGQAPPDRAVVLEERRAVVDGGVLRLDVAVSNGSAQPLRLEAMTASPGLQLVRLSARDEPGPVELPIVLPPGDYDPPVDLYQGRGPEVPLTLEVAVADCAAFDAPAPDFFLPAVTFRVAGGSGSNGFGGDPDLLSQLRASACDGQAPRGVVVTPTSADEAQRAEDAAERRYSALRRDHPFLTPD